MCRNNVLFFCTIQYWTRLWNEVWTWKKETCCESWLVSNDHEFLTLQFFKNVSTFYANSDNFGNKETFSHITLQNISKFYDLLSSRCQRRCVRKIWKRFLLENQLIKYFYDIEDQGKLKFVDWHCSSLLESESTLQHRKMFCAHKYLEVMKKWFFFRRSGFIHYFLRVSVYLVSALKRSLKLRQGFETSFIRESSANGECRGYSSSRQNRGV